MSHNRLENESSPYLLQHANNPVHWYSWGNEPITEARTQDKPILLSIGYAACHWCHVMAHESFEDVETAQIMNQYFVNIKVDREERPDVDKIYQQLHHVLNQQSGGWPLTVFLSPENLVPFFSGTYFPKERNYGRPSFKELLIALANFYAKERKEIQGAGTKLQEFLQEFDSPKELPDTKINQSILLKAKEQWLLSFDKQNGGFKGAPKFPMPATLSAILYICICKKTPLDDNLVKLVTHSLEKMAQGGIFDHISGGFFRYAVDAKWQIPHFEKMLYDNGQLIALYAVAFAINGNEKLKEVALGCIHWAKEEMKSSLGGYYSSLNADSSGGEGVFYIWEREEIQSLLGEQYQEFAQVYGVDKNPNFESKWHLIETETNQSLNILLAKEKLKSVRALRERPSTDDKILTAWNALMLKGLSLSSMLLNEKNLVGEATSLFQFIQNNLFFDNQLWVSYKNGQRKQTGFLDEYAFMLDALWYYLQTKWDNEALSFAIFIANKMVADFWDHENGGFYFTGSQHEVIVYRPKTWMDDSLPAGSVVAAIALLRFSYLLNNHNFAKIAQQTLKRSQAVIEGNPQYFSSICVLQSDIQCSPSILILYGKQDLLEKARHLLRQYIPNRFVFFIDASEVLPLALKQYQSKDEITIYVCQEVGCQVLKDLDELTKYI